MANLTPFRYPGSKNKLLPALTPHIENMMGGKNKFADVFVGGGSVLLETAAKFPKTELFANDKDHWMYSFWKVVSSQDKNDLGQLLELLGRKPTVKLFYELREDNTQDDVMCAYKALFFNRTAFSGILTSGPIGGAEQKSKWTVDCRYNEKALKKQVVECNKLLAGRTVVTNKDFVDCGWINNSDIVLYLDPPYYVKGGMLYRPQMNASDHQMLASLLSARQHWVLSYDDCPEVRKFYSANTITTIPARYCINGKKVNWSNKNELIITP